MSRSTFFRVSSVFLVLLTLHYALRPVLYWRTPIDFVLIACLIVAVRARPGAAALLGFTVGLLVGVQSPNSMASAALSLACVSFGASFLRASVFADRPAMNTIMFFGGKWVYDLVFTLVEGNVLSTTSLKQIFFWSVLAAMLTAVAGTLFLTIARPILGERPRD